MRYIDPHIHCSSRTTDDYERMAEAGIVAVIEPAFWLGQPRTTAGAFHDYFSSLVGFERFRAGQFGIKHYCTIGLNAKEANNERLAEEVLDMLPLFLAKDNVVAVGEIGFDDMTAAEERALRVQLDLAKELELPVMIHTPHRNKKKGTYRSMDIIEEHGLAPHMVVIDHNNEETCKEVLDRGYWAAFTIYPKTKMGNQRMVDIVKQYGSDRIIVDSSADWGMSDPLAVTKTGNLMLSQGISEEDVQLTCYKNAISAYNQSGQFNETDWLNPQPIDESRLFEGNSVLRGQRPDPGAPQEDEIIS
ncbi:TatD family hydrolase [Blastopirellula sp. JC732]|uniref:TatD family hydrolase n=1 Tax=Blastopirellula sediminis TaxID=2894196 RepID=A0A9X1MQ33_9BACT|nr:TatD family hydrolase [Blastopirellula sediminis]MCC9605332.1 TatD family hydrolase [Blastopirellula sediminis]MCC9631368.1 TatD family hydrolase [Blastopirellula sediminis]